MSPLAVFLLVGLLVGEGRGQLLLGAGTGPGSCSAPPYRARIIENWQGCSEPTPCCNEYGYCRPKSDWVTGVYRDCNGVSNGLALPPQTVDNERAAAKRGDRTGLRYLVVPRLGGILGGFFQAAGGIANGINNGITGTLGGLGSAIGGIANGAGSAVGGIANGAGTAVGGIASGVGGAVGGVASGVGGAVGGVATGVGGAVGGVANGVGGAVGGVANGVGGAVGGVASGVGGAVGGVANGVGGAVGGVASGTGNAVGGVVSGTGNAVGGTINGVGNVVGGVANGAGNAFGSTANGFGNTVGGGSQWTTTQWTASRPRITYTVPSYVSTSYGNVPVTTVTRTSPTYSTSSSTGSFPVAAAKRVCKTGATYYYC